MLKTEKRTFPQLSEVYWKEYWEHYPYYKHQPHTSWFSTPDCFRKLKTHRDHPKDYKFYQRRPSWHNRIYHRKPRRRESKYMVNMMYSVGMGYDEDLVYNAEDKFYPLYGDVVYYY